MISTLFENVFHQYQIMKSQALPLAWTQHKSQDAKHAARFSALVLIKVTYKGIQLWDNHEI